MVEVEKTPEDNIDPDPTGSEALRRMAANIEGEDKSKVEEKNEGTFIEGQDFFRKGQEVNVKREDGKLEIGKIFTFDDETVTLTFEVGKDSRNRKKMGSKTVSRQEFLGWQKAA